MHSVVSFNCKKTSMSWFALRIFSDMLKDITL
jgi:hypothetical protein